VDPGLFLRGVVVGFSIAAPVGPIGVLCIRRSLASGMRVGLAVGLGAATADAAYGCVAGFGLTAISGFLQAQKVWLALLGGAFLCYLGVRTWLSEPAQQAANVRGDHYLTSYLSTFFLTLTNPATILSFIAVFTAFGVGLSSNYSGAAWLVFGVFIGSAIWWLILSGSVGAFRSRISVTRMRWINRMSGALLFVFGVLALGESVWTLTLK